MSNKITRFSFPTTICFGPGAVKQLPICLDEIGVSRPLLVTDSGLQKTDVVGTVEQVLKQSSIQFSLFADVQPNPLDKDIEGALGVYRADDCDGVIGLGGGSPLDAAKAVAVLAANDGPLTLYDIQTGGNANIKGPLPPMVAIATTAGTGSEVGRCSVMTSGAQGRKFLVCHPEMMPKRAILDPELTVGLPATLTAATGMDALTHNIEALAVDAFHPMCDAIALKGIELVARYLEKAVKKPTDIEARGNMMIAAMMGAVAFQKDLGAAHSMAHPLSTECNVHHGLANAICLAPVMRFNKEVTAAKYADIARCFGINTSGMSELEAADQAIQAIIDLNSRIGIPRSLAEVGVKEEKLETLAQKAFQDPCHQSNPRPCTEQDLLELYKEAYGR